MRSTLRTTLAYWDSITVMSFVWIQWTNKFNDSISVNIKVHGKTTYEWHTGDIPERKSDIRMTYEDIRVTSEWHMSTYEWHTSTCDLRANDIKKYQIVQRFGAFRSSFSKLIVLKTLLYTDAKDFWSLGCFHSHTFYENIPKFNDGVWKPE